MFRRFIRFCRRLFASKGFRRVTRILSWLFIAYFIYNLALFLIAVMDTGASLREALAFFFELLVYPGRYPPSASVFWGIAIGLIWYYGRRWINRTDEEEEQKEAEKPAASAGPVQEEEFTGSNRYRSR